jgi:colanic acid biosynthesis glycosyl transferase WcaI
VWKHTLQPESAATLVSPELSAKPEQKSSKWRLIPDRRVGLLSEKKPGRQSDLDDSSVISSSRRRLYVFYHYLFPDRVVSAVLMDQLGEGLVERGWDVTGFPGNRGSRDETPNYPPRDTHKGVVLRRIWRPRFRQSSTPGRLLNAAWMITRWSLLALKPNPPAAIIVGTDPILSVSVAIVWKMIRPRTRVVHWCFDLYPEAAYADEMISPSGLIARVLERVLHRAYAACDAIVDIGPCMRHRLARYPSQALNATIVPWALEEPVTVLPVAVAERAQIFGPSALAMLYSGTFGRAHTYELFLALASRLRGKNAKMAFSVRGNREDELRSAINATPLESVCTLEFVPFAPDERLLERLAAADVHLISLADNWTGLVVPSKFFGAIAAGRPVLFSGSPDSAVALWITEHKLGWVLNSGNIDATAEDLLAYVRDPIRVTEMNRRCLSTYQNFFSRHASLDHMDVLLTGLVPL